MTQQLKPGNALHNYNVYRDHLCNKLAPLLNDFIYEAIYKPCYDANKAEAITKMQKTLFKCNAYKDENLEGMYTSIEQQLPWLREVIRQMLTQHIYVLTSTRGDKACASIDIQSILPPNRELMRNLFMCVCKHMCAYASLYDHTHPNYERNVRKAENQVFKCLKERALLDIVPLDDIVKNHLCKPPPAPEPEPEPETNTMAALLESEKPIDIGAAEVTVPAQVDIKTRKRAFTLDDESFA